MGPGLLLNYQLRNTTTQSSLQTFCRMASAWANSLDELMVKTGRLTRASSGQDMAVRVPRALVDDV